jgi:hypothetical protein
MADTDVAALAAEIYRREDIWSAKLDDPLAARIEALEKALDPQTFGGFANSIGGLLESLSQQMQLILDALEILKAALPQQAEVDAQIAKLKASNDRLAAVITNP